MPCEMSYIFLSFIRTTIVVLGSFLDTFQKIADAASNTKGNLYFTSNIPIAKGSVIFLPIIGRQIYLIIVSQKYLSFYDSMRNWTNFETGRSHISFKMDVIIVYDQEAIYYRSKVQPPVYEINFFLLILYFTHRTTIILQSFSFSSFSVQFEVKQVYKYSNICLAETINLHP